MDTLNVLNGILAALLVSTLIALAIWGPNVVMCARNWLLLVLAGKSTVIINARIENGTIIVDGADALIAKTSVDNSGTGATGCQVDDTQ